MSSIMQILRRVGGAKTPPTSGSAGQLALWKAGTAPTDATSLYAHDGTQWVELLDTSRNPRVITANDAVAGLRITQAGTGEALRVEDEANPDATPFVVASDGKVGIGTSSPQSNVHVVGVGSTPVTQSPVVKIESGPTGAASLIFKSPLYHAITCEGAGVLGFTIGGKEYARLIPSGEFNFGNGDPDPVTGTRIRVLAGGQFNFYRPPSTNTSWPLDFRNGTTSVGHVSYTDTATTYATSSDYRLKEDLQPIATPSARLALLKPVNFAWKANGSRVDGFIAHEVQAVVPEAVTGTKDAVDADGNPILQGIDQSKLAPLTIAALQEAFKRIEVLEAEVATLKGTH